MAAWSTYDVARDAQTSWLVRLYEKTVNGVREIGKIPTGENNVMRVIVPTLSEQAEVMRFRDQLPPGHNTPTGVLDWLD